MHITATIDGSSLGNGTADALGGYGVVISDGNGIVIHASKSLCDSCDANVQSNNRAELKAAIFALRFVHEVAKIGLPHNCSQIASDERPIEPRGFSVTVRSDSEYVVRGYNGRNNYKTHTDLWKNFSNFSKCLRNTGASIVFQHVYGHSGDPLNELADKYAKRAAKYRAEGDFVRCESCDIEVDDAEDIALHYKLNHFEMSEVTEIPSSPPRNAEFTCDLCDKELKAAQGLRQHMYAKHGVRY